jgi:hypothetical protein
MDAQGTMRLMFDTMDAYDRTDFDRLAEIYAEDAQWLNANPDGPLPEPPHRHCQGPPLDGGRPGSDRGPNPGTS